MNLTDEQLLELQKSGAKFNAPPAKPQAAPKPTSLSQIVGSIRELSKAIVAANERPTPSVNIPAPKVSVSPQFTVATPQKWKVEVSERDGQGRIKSMTIEAAS
jgi:hypothetical protein